MTESKVHENAKRKAPGKPEVPLPGGGRLDSGSKKTATEIERSGDPKLIGKAVKRLAKSGRPRKVLQVPQKDMPKAAKIMRKHGLSGTVKNMGRTKRRSV